ncbi:MAG: GTPase [Kineosporiaceae bacterium]
MTLLTGLRTREAEPRRFADRLAALDEVLALSPGRLDDEVVAEAGRVAAKAGQRLRLGAEHTVVALAGATGSGKSSLFNALVGDDVSTVGLRRPTTGVAHAAVRGPEPADALLDWLAVPNRHLVAAPPGSGPAGPDVSVLLDLPDVDSVEPRHRIESDRLVEQVDLLVWVLDPQKYADASVHERYLAPLAARGYADVMLVVLNQVDRLPVPARAACLADLRELLASEGLGSVPVLATSARTGEGVEALQEELRRRAERKRAAVRRLEADLSALAGDLEGSCGGPTGARVLPRRRQALVEALGEAAGVETVAAAVAGAHRMRGHRATGWPLTRWTARLRPDPARRLRLPESPSELVRTSIGGASALQRARIDTALRELAAQVSEGLPEPWPQKLRAVTTARRDDLPDRLDRAIAGADLGLSRPPRWWRVVGLVQGLLVLTAVAGLVWLGALFALAWLQLPDPPLPHVGPLPLPTLLLGGGLVLGLVLAVLARPFVRLGAARRARAARHRLSERVATVADEIALAPLQTELAARARLCEALARLRG